MNIFQSAIETLKKYADFKGRASREEFWSFFIFVIIAPAIAGFVGLFFGAGYFLPGIVSLLLFVPQLAVAVRRLHDVGRTGRELGVPLVMLFLMPIAFQFGGILPKIVALGFLGMTLLVFANLVTLFLKKGSTVPNRYGAAPTAYSFAG